MPSETSELIPTRQSLLSRLKNWEDQDSWADFFETYWRLIYNTAIKAGLTDSEAQDVVQETVLSVVKSMPQFTYNSGAGSFKAWLLRLTRWRIVDQFRRRSHKCEPLDLLEINGSRTSELEQAADPAGCQLEQIWNEEWKKNILEVALERVKRQVDPKQYQIFDLYALRNWPVKKIAETLRINPGRIYLTKHQVTGLLKKEIKQLEKKPI